MSLYNQNPYSKGSKRSPFPAPFPIKVETYIQPIIDRNVGMYEQHVVCANGMVIAHFLSVTSRDSYLEYLKKYGFKEFPKKIMDILEHQATGKPFTRDDSNAQPKA